MVRPIPAPRRVLDLVNPARAGGNLLGRRCNSGFDEAGRQQTSWLGFYAHNMVGI
jgi:hypothetical protein